MDRRKFLGMLGASGALAAVAACTSDHPGTKAAVVTGSDGSLPDPGGARTSIGPRVEIPTTSPPPQTVAKTVIPATISGTNRPPQLIMISFDGSGSTDLMRYWRNVGHETGARFSFFLSGVYFLTKANSKLYRAPGHDAGASAIGFFQPGSTNKIDRDSKTDMYDMLVEWKAAHEEGHEIGTHYNGHFCDGYKQAPVNTWTSDGWRSEIAQFGDLLHNVVANNGLKPIDLGFSMSDIKGGRTPCLEGKLDSALYPVLEELGMRYDSSRDAAEGVWPKKYGKIWSLPLHNIEVVGHNTRNLSMDYNFYYTQSFSKAEQKMMPTKDPAVADEFRQQTYDSYMKYFHNAYNGSRNPMIIGHHFARWNMGAYVDAITQVIRDVSKMPEVHFVTKTTVVDYLESLTPDQLKAFRNQKFSPVPKV